MRARVSSLASEDNGVSTSVMVGSHFAHASASESVHSLQSRPPRGGRLRLLPPVSPSESSPALAEATHVALHAPLCKFERAAAVRTLSHERLRIPVERHLLGEHVLLLRSGRRVMP